MKFSIFKNVKANRGRLCTYEVFKQVSGSKLVSELCAQIAAETDHDKQGELKKQLPVITFQAYFEGARKNDLAQLSGCFMYDGDGIEDPKAFYEEKVAGRIEELGILYAGMTPSRHGLRLVARLRPEFKSIAEGQQWLGEQVGWECDPQCKDLARASYVVPEGYVFFLDEKGMFEEEVNSEEIKVNSEEGKTREASPECLRHYPGLRPPLLIEGENGENVDHIPTFKGIALGEIAREWLMMTGGEPEEGERNDRLYSLALRLRHITDYNESTLLAVMPRYGLGEQEMKTLIHSACTATRTHRPKDLQPVFDKLRLKEKGPGVEEEEEIQEEPLSLIDAPLSASHLSLPPLIKQIASTAPSDFMAACIICQLPMLGTLASKLRAKYLDGKMHSPSFQVSLEAPQASGKSFMTRIVETLMEPVLARDMEERQKEQEYAERLGELKVTNVKVTSKNREEMLGQRPKGIIRYVPATISVTKLLQRLDNARGLHLFAFAEEIDTVTKAFKRGFSSYGDLLRVAFDNGLYGQDYASSESFSGLVTAYYNTLFSGTPKAMRRFYPDVEDGLVSRVCFVMIPDQFGKPMPEWGELREKDMEEVRFQLTRLDQVSIIGNAVQPDHVMDLSFLNRDLKKWLTEQQKEAVRTNDRTRDVFCRRSAVVGFRAGMLAWFLYGEKDTPLNRRRTIAFSRWIANQMLTQHLLRFEIEGTGSNVNRWEEAYKLLKDEFTRDELAHALKATGSSSPVKQVVFRWRLLGCVKTVEEAQSPSGQRQSARFRKVSL
jgi:hypothetical protein